MNRELALFAELWPHINKKSPAITEDSVSLSETILTQIDVIEHERDENQLVLEI